MDQSGEFFDEALLMIGLGLKAMKDEGKSYDEMRSTAYAINSAISTFVSEVLNAEDPEYESS